MPKNGDGDRVAVRNERNVLRMGETDSQEGGGEAKREHFNTKES